MPKSTHFTYFLNIDIEIFCKYRIEIEKVISKNHYYRHHRGVTYRRITNWVSAVM